MQGLPLEKTSANRATFVLLTAQWRLKGIVLSFDFANSFCQAELDAVLRNSITNKNIPISMVLWTSRREARISDKGEIGE